MILIAHRTNLTNDLTVAVALRVIFFYSVMAYQNNSFEGYVADAILYLVALRYAMAGLKQSSSKFSIMNRFYPQISRLKHLYFFFVTPPQPYSGDPSKINPHHINADVSLLKGRGVFVGGRTQADRFSILSLINQLRNMDPTSHYRKIALWTDNVTYSLDDNGVEQEFVRFKEDLKNSDVHWCLVERSALDRVGSSIAEIEGLCEQQFILVNGFPQESEFKSDHLFICLDDGCISWIRPCSEAREDIEGLAKAKEFVFEEFDDVEIE